MFAHFDTVHECEGQTVGQTDGRTDRLTDGRTYVVAIALYFTQKELT